MTSTASDDGGSMAVEPARPELVLPPDANVAAIAEGLVEQARVDGVGLTGEGGLLTGLIQQVMHTALEVEMTDHLGGRRLLVKELAFQALPFVPDWLLDCSSHSFIVRGPVTTFSSLVRLKPDFTEEEFGFTSLDRLDQRLQSLAIRMPGVCGDALQTHPRATVAAYCKAIGIRFHDGMLRWDDGRVRPWAEHERASQQQWHHRLEASTGLIETVTEQIEPPSSHERLVTSAEDIFARLSERVVDGLAMTETT